MMNLTTIIVTVAALIAIGAFLYGTIDKRIENKINQPEFIRKVASEMRIPSLIFNENEQVVYDMGACEFINIDKIQVKKNQKADIEEIIISPKSFLKVAPILTSIDSEIYFGTPERVKPYDWKYTTVEGPQFIAIEGFQREKIISRFRLEIIK